MNSGLDTQSQSSFKLKSAVHAKININACMQSKWYGLIDIDQGFILQEQFLKIADLDRIQVIGCEHFEVLSLGKSAWSMETSSFTQHFQQIHKTHRGGKITLHNPGQLIVYPSMNLKHYTLSIKAYVGWLLEISKLCLAELGLKAEIRTQENIGLYVDGKKIGSIGLRCQKGWVSHGLSINVSNDLEKFKLFDVCGQALTQLTSLKNEGLGTSTHELYSLWIKHFENSLKDKI